MKIKPGDRIRFTIPTEQADWEGEPSGPGQIRLFWGREQPIENHNNVLAARYDPSRNNSVVVVEVISGYTNLFGRKIPDFVSIYGYEGQYAPATAVEVVGHDAKHATPHPTGQSIYEDRKKRQNYCKWGCLNFSCR